MEIKLKCSNYSLKFNLKESIKNIFDFNIGSALTEIIKIEESKEIKAFQLLFNTFHSTNVELRKRLGQAILDKNENLVILTRELEIEIKSYFEQEITITKDFFEDVIKYSPEYLKQSFKLFKNNCIVLGINVPENFEYEYYTTYRNNLKNEFQENKNSYLELVNYFDNPIYEQNQDFDKQLDHYRYIKSFYTNSLRSDNEGSSESLKDLYVEPNFKIYKNNTVKNYDDFEFSKDKISIHNFLNNYFLKGIKYDDLKSNYNMLFLLGQPGQGKTSFCYKLIYDYLETNQGLPSIPLYFVKIRDLVAKDFIDSTFNTINKHLKQNIRFEEDNCILILDGLDEAYMAGGLNDSDLKNLYDRLNKTAQQNINLKVILTSRLNYLKVNNSCLDKSLVCQLSVLTDKQISEYATKFKKFYPNNIFLNKIDQILSEPKYIHIKELLQQAVLIYFVAIADVDIEEKDSKANIYNKIFDSIAKRSWDKQRGQLDYIKPKVKEDCKLYTKYLRAYIRNIAFVIFQSPNLYITLDELSELESTQIFINRCFNDDLLKSIEDIKEINKYLLISFYFQESNNNKTTDTAIEFFHNSLWEYLTAEYMWEENKKLLLKRDLDDEEEYQNVSKEIYFDFLNKLVGQKELEYMIRNNLIDIIENENDEIKKAIFNQSIKLFYKLSDDNFLLEYSKINKLGAFEKATTIFDVFWTFLIFSKANFNHPITTNSNINHFAFGMSKFGFKKISYMNFEGDSFYLHELIHELVDNTRFYEFNDFKYLIRNNFTDSIFDNCIFHYCCFDENYFMNVEFISCSFSDITFSSNKFSNVKFINVEVSSNEWFEIFCKENDIDEFTLDNHKIEAILKKDYKDENVIKYYLRYIGK